MGKVVIRTKFNKTGKRVLKIPLEDRQICAPAYQQYREARHAADEQWRHKWDSAKRAYIETIAHWMASYVARESTSFTERYKITKFLAEQSLAERSPMNIEGPGSSQRWSIQLGGMSKLSSIEQKAWKAYVTVCRKADDERDNAITEACEASDEMARVLRREIHDNIMSIVNED